MNDFSKQVIAEFRASKGIVGGHFANARVLLLHEVGMKTGREYVIPLVYLQDGESFLVAGSNGGAVKEPAWVANLEAMEQAIVEVGGETLTVRASVIRQRTPERDRLYTRLVEYWPDYLEYEKHTDRLFPVVRLEPIG